MNRRYPLLSVWIVFSAVHAFGQTPTIGTVAGGGRPGSAATAYAATGASAVAVDASGNLYVAVTGRSQVWVVSPRGSVTEVIGNGAATYSGDSGPAISAGLNRPAGIALDSNGNLLSPIQATPESAKSRQPLA